MSGRNEILNVANLSRPKGLKGEIRATAFGDFLPELEGGEVILYTAKEIQDGFLVSPNFFEKINLESVTDYGENTYLLRLTGVNDRTAAERYRALHIGLPLQEAIERFGDAEDPYLFEYLGLEVIDTESRETQGKIERVFSDALDWLYVRMKDDSLLMVPVNGPYLGKIEREENRLWVSNLEDLKP